MVLCACYIMAASLFLALKNFDHLVMAWGQDLQMTVYLKENSTQEEVKNLVDSLKAKAVVQNVTQVSSSENLSQFKSQMGTLLPSLQDQAKIQALIPSTLQVLFNLKDSLTEPVRIFSEVAESIKDLAAVEEVSYGQIWVEKFSGFFTIVRQLLWLMSLVLLVASVFVFSNSVRTLVEAKRFEIEVLELVGATNWKIRKPFVYRGAMLGLMSGATAVATVSLLISSLKTSLMESDLLASMASRLQNFTLTEALSFIVFSILIGMVAAYFCVREINSGWAALERG
jgi:cell division transport system permease protein